MMNVLSHLENSGTGSQTVPFNSILTILFPSEILRGTRKIVESVGIWVILWLDSKYFYPNTGNKDIQIIERNNI